MNCLNMFGCYEMEQAAAKIYGNEKVTVEDYKEDDDLLIGFVMLAAYGWIEPDYPNGVFVPTRRFNTRISKLSGVPVTRRHLESK